MKTYHFISGLPRSGSTLLTAILNQNPRFHSSISNPLARYCKAIIEETYAGPGYALECSEIKRALLIKNLIETYHSDFSQEVCFNTHRGWGVLLPLLDQTYPNAKLICCVRDINWILDSFECLFRANPFALSKLYNDRDRETVYTRSHSLMQNGQPLRFAYDCLKEAITGPHKHKIMLIEYEQLARNPQQTISALYNFIGEPYYDHDFNNVVCNYDEYDHDAGIRGLHTIRQKVEFQQRTSILPPDIWDQFKDLEVWR